MRKLGRFTLERELGRGGFGIVYQAFDPERGEIVALKQLHRAGAPSIRRFKEEFRSLADVVDPGLLALQELFVEEQACWFTMELVEGVDLATWLGIGGAPRGRTTATVTNSNGDVLGWAISSAPKEARDESAGAAHQDRLRSTFVQLTRAVRALHAHGKLHRDLKPSNVIVRPSGALVLLDYGLVSDLELEQTGFCGTAAYAAPEQFAPGVITPASDWYAVGVMLFEALTGRLPFPGSAEQIAIDKQLHSAPAVASLAPNADPALAALADALLCQKPQLRPDAEQLAAVLSATDQAAIPAAPSGLAVRFVGRAKEMGQLLQLAARAANGGGEVVVLSGPSGMGKSRLAEELASRVQMPTLRGRCHAREYVPFNAFDGIVDGLAALVSPAQRAQLGFASRMFPALAAGATSAELADDHEFTGDPRERRLQGFCDLRRLIEQLAQDRPLLVLIDDVQWADRDSVELLDTLLSEPIPRVLVLFTLRTVPSGAHPAVPHVAEPWATAEIALGPIAAQEARALVAAHSHIPRERLEAALAATAGHPLSLLEIARHEQPLDTFDFYGAVRARTARLSEGARHTLALLAIAMRGVLEDILFQAAAIERSQSAAVLRELRAAGLVRISPGRIGWARVELAHDGIREALLEPHTADDGWDKPLHLALIRALEPTHEIEQLVYHCSRAGQSTRAASLAHAAAEQAMQALAFDRAANLYLLAWTGSEADAALPLRRRLADALTFAHRGAEAADVLLAIAEHSSAHDERSDALRRATELLLTTGQLERAQHVMGRLFDAHGYVLPGSTSRAVAALAIERGKLSLERQLPALRRPIPDAELTVLRSLSFGLGMIDNLRAAVFQTRWMRGALASQDPVKVGQALALEGIFRGSLGRAQRPEGYARIEQAEALARDCADQELRCWVVAARATVDALGHQRSQHVAQLDRAIELFRRHTRGTGWAITSLTLVRALTVRIRGDLRGVRVLLRDALADARRRADLYLETTLRRGSSILFLADDDPEGGRAALRDTRWQTPWQGFHIQHWLELEAASEIDLYEGAGAWTLARRSQAFERLRWSLVRRQQRVRILADSLRARLLLARAKAGIEVRASLVACRLLASNLEAEGLPYAAVHAGLHRAGALVLEGKHAAAAAVLERVVAAADEQELSLLREAARHRLGQLLGGARGDQLRRSASEWLREARVRNIPAMLRVEAPFMD